MTAKFPEVPTTILLERERANSFRRHMEILHERCTDTVAFSDLRMSQWLIQELAWYKGTRFQLDSPLVTVEWAVSWANHVPPPPISILRQAREMLQSAADDWLVSFQMAHEIRSKFIVLEKCELPDWLVTCVQIASSEQQRMTVILSENWPGGGREQEEKTLSEMRAGIRIGLDDAFRQIAGVSSEEWEKKVEQHRKIRKAQGE